MATVFRPPYTTTDPVTGKRVKRKSRRWWIRYYTPDGVRHRVKGYTDKKATQALAAVLERRGIREAAGVVEPSDVHAAKPLIEHLADYSRHLDSKGNTAKHARQTIMRCQATLQGCKAIKPADLTAAAVIGFLHELQQPRQRPPLPIGQEWFTKGELMKLTGVRPESVKAMMRRYGLETKGNGSGRRYSRVAVEAVQELLCRGCGITTRNGYLTAIKGFTRWLVREHRIIADPLAGLGGLNSAADRRRERRALSVEELHRLLDGARFSDVIYLKLTGLDRCMLYGLAAGSGFRAAELAALTPADFNLDGIPATVRLAACYAKNGKEAIQPLPPGLAGAFHGYLAGKLASDPVWPGAWKDEAADMLRVDLDAAGIAYADEDGRVCDFHALRHSYVTLLSRSGVAPKMAQELARHSDIRLTMNVYTHAGLYDLAAAVDTLPAILPTGPRAERQALRATGTDGKAGDKAPKNLAPFLVPQVAISGDSESQAETETADSQGEGNRDGIKVSVQFTRGKEGEAPPGFEPGLADLQSAALPLG
jgi:integrase